MFLTYLVSRGRVHISNVAKSANDPNVQVFKLSGSSNWAQITLVVDGWWLLTMIKQYSIQLKH